MKVFALLGGAPVFGALAGVLLDVATFLVARYGPQADGWSFRGNGALLVPFGQGPVILAGAWTALVARYRGFDRWLLLGVAAGLVGTGFVLISVLALVLFNSDGMGVSNAMTFFHLGLDGGRAFACGFRTGAGKPGGARAARRPHHRGRCFRDCAVRRIYGVVTGAGAGILGRGAIAPIGPRVAANA